MANTTKKEGNHNKKTNPKHNLYYMQVFVW